MADRFVEQMTQEATDPFVGSDKEDKVEAGESSESAASDRGDNVEEVGESEVSQEPQESGAVSEEVGSGDVPESQSEPVSGESAEDTNKDEQPRGSIQIPKHRLDQEVRKRRALESQLDELRSRADAGSSDAAGTDDSGSVSPESDMGDVVKNMFEMVLDGETEKATRIFTDTMSTAISQATDTAQEGVSGAIKRHSEMERFTLRIDEIVKDFPVLDSTNTDTFDADLCERVNAVRDGFISRGYRLTDALDEAVGLVLRADNPDSLKVAGDGRTSSGGKAPRPVKVEKNLKAAAKQPPRLGDAGTSVVQDNRSTVFEMDDEAFEKMTETELAKLRGDFA